MPAFACRIAAAGVVTALALALFVFSTARSFAGGGANGTSRSIAGPPIKHHVSRALPVGGVPLAVGGAYLTTALRSRYPPADPLYGFYGGPAYYGGPLYFRPYYDGFGPIYFETHPIVEW